MYSGIIPPLVTPIDDNNEVCESSVEQLINYVRPFSSALMPTLTSGEGWKLSGKQWRTMVEYTLRYAGNLHVLVGIEYPTTREVIEYGALAKKLGAHGIVVTAPFGSEVNQDIIFEHFSEIDSRLNFPIFVYNEKEISGNNIEYETILEICKLKSISGIKEASGDVNYTNRLIKDVHVPVYQGWENLAWSTENPAGYIFPLSNLDPAICCEMFNRPSCELQSKIDCLCQEYDILDSAPCLNIKKNLKIRNIIKSDRMINGNV